METCVKTCVEMCVRLVVAASDGGKVGPGSAKIFLPSCIPELELMPENADGKDFLEGIQLGKKVLALPGPTFPLSEAATINRTHIFTHVFTHVSTYTFS